MASNNAKATNKDKNLSSNAQKKLPSSTIQKSTAPKTQKPVKLTPEEEVKLIPKAIIEERFIQGHIKNFPRSYGQKLADLTARWVGSWTFIGLVFIVIAVWMSINLYIAATMVWDPYPFILLNFVLSCLAALQAPIILMSQNRQSELDRMKSERDFAVNRKAEKEISNIQKDLDDIKLMIRKMGQGTQKPNNKVTSSPE